MEAVGPIIAVFRFLSANRNRSEDVAPNSFSSLTATNVDHTITLTRRSHAVLTSWKRAFVVALLAITASAFASGNAQAGNYYRSYYQPRCTYKTVVSYEYRKQAYSKYVTVYDKYGCPHRVKKTYYRTVKVPVAKRAEVGC